MPVRSRRSDSTLLLVAAGLLLALFLLRGCASRQPSAVAPLTVAPFGVAPSAGVPSQTSPHLALGMPTDRDPSDDVVLDERDFVLSFNPARLVPNWVAWELDARYLGHARRRDDFRTDPSLPPNVVRVSPHDYLHSGYDRGHLCPSADRNATEAMNSSTFLMTNMVPQVHEANAGPWEKLEEHERELAAKPDAELFIVAGPVFDENPRTIGRGVAVPRATYKIIVVLASGQNAQNVTPSTAVVSVIVPNEPGVAGHTWTEYATSVDEVERQSGYDFLNAIPDDVEPLLESRTSL